MVFALRVSVSPDRIEAGSGESFNVSVTVRNTSDIVEHYVIETLGLPPGAQVSCDPEVTKLRPGETGAANVRVTLQQDPPTPAGYYIVGMLARSRYRHDVSRCEELPLSVRPEERVAIRVAPEVATGGRTARYAVEVGNAGNTPVRLRLAATDPERRVTSVFQPSELDLPPGATGQAVLSVSAPIPWSKETQRLLTIEAAGAGVGGTGTATFAQRPRFASKLTRVAGMLAAVLLLAGAVLGAALIARKANEQPAAAPSPAGAPTPGGAPGNNAQASPSAPPTATPTAPAGASPTADGGAGATTAPPAGAAQPVTIDLTQPPGGVQNGQIPSDAFREQGLIIGGAPDPGDPAQCADANAIVVDQESPNGPFITAARPDQPTECRSVAVQIRFLQPVAAVEVTLGGQGTRRMEVKHRDLFSQVVTNNLTASDDGRHNGIDYITVRGQPADRTAEAPPAAIKSIRFTPLAAQ
jgi:hypothetical protein